MTIWRPPAEQTEEPNQVDQPVPETPAVTGEFARLEDMLLQSVAYCNELQPVDQGEDVVAQD